MDFQHRIHACRQDLWRWGRDYFRNFGCKIQQLKARLDLLRNSRDSGDVALFHAAEEQLRVLFSQEELYWRQWSKQLWLKDGDHNTKFFHRFATHRRKSNLLPRLRAHTRLWVEGGAMNDEVMRYYTDIF